MADSGIPPVEDMWSDNKCIEIAYKDHFPALVKDISVQKSIIDRFLNFYLRGKPQKGLSVTDLTFAVISIMPLHEKTEQFIFEPDHYTDEGTLYFLTAADKLKAAIDEIKPNDGQEQMIDDENSIPVSLDTEGSQSHTSESTNTFDGENYDEAYIDKLHNESYSQNVVDDSKFAAKENSDNNREHSIKKPQDTQSHNIHDDQEQRNEGKIGETIKKCIPKLPLDLIKYNKVSRPIEKEEIRPQYGPVENAAFIISCNKLLDEWDTKQSARIVLKYFFGIVALILMRTVTKKYMHLVNTFGSTKFLTTISFAKDYIKYSVPHKKCYKNCYRIFSKRDGNIPIMFAKIVYNSLHIEVKLNIFKVALLAHTADYGFGLMSMIQNLVDQLGNINTIVEATYCDETAESWYRIKNFMETYMTSSSKVATYRWARVISTQYFRDISCSTNYQLAVILAVFTEKVTKSSDIWKSSWVENCENLEKLKNIGLDMYQKLFMYKLADGT